MGEMVCERVWWATGSWTGYALGMGWAGGVRGAVVGYGCYIGIWDVSNLGVGTTLGGVTTLGGGAAVQMVDGGARAVLVFQWEKRSQSLEIDDSCSWWIVVEVSLTEQDKKFRVWTILS